MSATAASSISDAPAAPTGPASLSTVVDWCHAAKADQSKLREDLVHPTPERAAASSHAVRDALEHRRAGDRTVPGVSGV